MRSEMGTAGHPDQGSIANGIRHAAHLARGYFAATNSALADNTCVAGDIP
jgi:hypothetical protein